MEHKDLQTPDCWCHTAPTSSPLHPKEFIASVLVPVFYLTNLTNERFLDCDWDLQSNSLVYLFMNPKSLTPNSKPYKFKRPRTLIQTLLSQLLIKHQTDITRCFEY